MEGWCAAKFGSTHSLEFVNGWGGATVHPAIPAPKALRDAAPAISETMRIVRYIIERQGCPRAVAVQGEGRAAGARARARGFRGGRCAQLLCTRGASGWRAGRRAGAESRTGRQL